jgi:hypothetical protein
MSLLSKINTKMSYGLTQTVDFVAWPPKTQPKSPMTGEGQHEVSLVQENLASQLKINTKKVFWPHKESGFCSLAAQNTDKSTQDGLKTNLKDHGPRKSGLPVQKIVILQIISYGAKLRERSVNTLIISWPSSGQDLRGNG